MKLYHLVNDEKFIDDAIELFELCYPNQNKFFVMVPDYSYNCKCIKRDDKVINIAFKSRDLQTVLQELNPGDALFLHYLDHPKAKAVEWIPAGVKVVWLAFGSEFYESSTFYKGKLYHWYTWLALMKDRKYLYRRSKGILRKVYNTFNNKSSTKVLSKAFEKINYLGTPVPEEVELYSSSIPNFKPRPFYFRYGAIEQIVQGIDLAAINLGNGIFVGNSNTPTSNHLDVLHKLHKLDCVDRDIIVPLNYGNWPGYRQQVLKQGDDLFSEKFKPLLKFVDKETYIKEVLISCRTAILYHERQQGLGNVILLIWLGAKVFLSVNNPIYTYLKRLGIEVFSFKAALHTDIKDTLSDEVKNKNRELLIAEFGLENTQIQLISAIESLQQN